MNFNILILIISNNYENLLDVVTIIFITSLKDGRKIYPNELLLENELEILYKKD